MSKYGRLLSRKFTITIFLLAFPLFVISLNTFLRHVQELMHQEALKRSSTILNTTMQTVVNYMSAVETAAKSNAWLLEENFDPESLQNLSRRIVSFNRSVISCTVSTEPDALPQSERYFSVYTVNDGDTIITMLEPDFDYTERAYYQAPVQTGKACWIDPFSDFNEGSINFTDAVASYSIPLRPHGDKIEGVLSTECSFHRLHEIIRKTDYPFPSAYYMLLSGDGHYLIHPETSLLFKKTIFSETDSIQHPDVIALGNEMVAGKTGIMHVVKDDVKLHVCYAPVPGTNWSLALVCHDDEVLTDFYHLTYLVILIVFVGLIFILWLTAIVVRRNINPLHELLETTKKMADGQYGQEIPRSNRKDIVSRLQNAFAAMQDSIMSRKENISHTAEMIKEENEKLAEATKLAEKSTQKRTRFILHVLRQIQTPLNVIDGLTQVMLNNIPTKNDMGDVPFTLKLNATRLLRRVLMLYDISAVQDSDEMMYKRDNEVHCNEIAKEGINYVHVNNPNKEIRFETELPDDTAIMTNHLYLLRSFCELLLNAVKFSDGKHITFRVAQTETSVRFTIEDVGPGMPKDWEELVSQPFEKVNELSEGLGVGLPLVKHHIDSLGGELVFDTEYQQGCRISILMPK